MPYKQNVKVAIKIDKDLKEEFGITLISNSANFELEVAHKENFDLKSADAIRNFRDFSTHFIAELLPKIALYNNINDHLRHLAEEENVFSRSLIFSDVMTLSQNVFGGLAWINLSEVSKSIKKAAYKLQRTTQWKPKTKINKVEKQLKMGEGDAPEDIANADNIKHSERRVVSLIDVPLWNNAKWHGTLFMVYQDGVFPPCIGLLFKGEDSARKIFKGWLDQFGKKDENESLRVCIITGIDKKNPTHYRVHIGTNIKAHMGMEERKQLLFVSRIQTMTPDSDKNLSMFLKAYEKYGVYYLLPAIYEEDWIEPKVIRDLFLYKKSLIVKPAWQIGDNDVDLMALQSNDDPIIPANLKNAPVNKALKRVKRMMKTKGRELNN